VYEITDAGRRTARRWLEEMLAEPRQEFPEFPAALSHVLKTEYQRAVLAAEARWVTQILDELRSGELTWSREELLACAETL
jgi:DNA-binding PadR family transcriptional regulator